MSLETRHSTPSTLTKTIICIFLNLSATSSGQFRRDVPKVYPRALGQNHFCFFTFCRNSLIRAIDKLRGRPQMGFLQLVFLPFQRRCMMMVSEAFWEIRAIAEARGRSLMVTISLFRESLTLPFICFPNLLQRQRRSHPFSQIGYLSSFFGDQSNCKTEFPFSGCNLCLPRYPKNRQWALQNRNRNRK